MPVNVADRFGPYEIVRPISAGGMGEVYLARDTRLERDVALKMLPPDLAGSGEYQRRFLQEARAASALNHPNILAIYDVGTDHHCPFLITELVDGVTLRHEIDRGRVPVRRLLDIAAQVAEGLAAAHEAGIVHRDLKPENIMIARDGRVRILDFGLAKITGARGAATQAETEIGAVLGTLPYMSPEQGRGGVVDFRSDQFSFGVLLYEMATGGHPFRRETGVQTLAAIIEHEPRPLGDASAATPAPLRWIIDRCLAKDPSQRYAATADLARDLSTLRVRLSEADAEWLMPAPRSWRRRVAQVALVALLVAGVLAWGLAPRLKPSALESLRVTPLVVDGGYQGAPAWSPDEQTLAYVAEVSGILQVFTRNLASSATAPLTAAAFSCFGPFWSSDGTHVYYHSRAENGQGLYRVSAAAGGEPHLVLPNAFRATLSPDGRRLAFLKEGSSQGGRLTLWMADADGSGERHVPLPIDRGGMTEGWLRFSPDGSTLLLWGYGFLRSREDVLNTDLFWLVSPADGTARPVLRSFSEGGRDLVSFDWLPDSRRVVISSTDQHSARRRLWVADVERDWIEPLTLNGIDEGYPAVSRNGRVAYTSEAVNFDLVAIPTDGRPARTMLATTRNEYDPAFSKARAQYAFVSDRRGALELSLRSADGRFDMPLVTNQAFPGDYTWTLGSLAFSPDGARIAFQRLGERSGYRIWISDTAGAGPPVPLAPIPIGNMHQDGPTWSPPDGHWIAYVQGIPGGTWRLVKARARGGEPPQVLSETVVPLSRPAWSPDGKWILFDSLEGLAIVAAEGGTPRVLSLDPWFAFGWSDDSQTIFGLRESDDRRGHYMLASLDVASGRERIVAVDLGAIPPATQPIRGLSSMGNGEFATSIAHPSSGIFALDGVQGIHQDLLRSSLPGIR